MWRVALVIGVVVVVAIAAVFARGATALGRGWPITGYHHSTRRTVGEGVRSSGEALEQGHTRLVFSRATSRPDGREATMNAVVYVQPTGQAVLATYGQLKGASS